MHNTVLAFNPLDATSLIQSFGLLGVLAFNRYGPAKAVTLARFIPVVRTFINPVAGVLHMPARRFLLWNVVGGVLWTDGVLLVGYLPARKLRDTIGAANIDKYLLPVVALIVVISFVPIVIEVIRNRREGGWIG